LRVLCALEDGFPIVANVVQILGVIASDVKTTSDATMDEHNPWRTAILTATAMKHPTRRP
jgi:hypothetical protein